MYHIKFFSCVKDKLLERKELRINLSLLIIEQHYRFHIGPLIRSSSKREKRGNLLERGKGAFASLAAIYIFPLQGFLIKI